MTLPRPFPVQDFDSQDQFNNAYSDWGNPRPLVYAARYSWTTDSDGIPEFGPVQSTVGAWGGFIYLKPGGTSRKLGQWGSGGIICKVTSTSPLKVQPVKTTAFDKDADLSDFQVTAVPGYSPAMDDVVEAFQLTDLSSEQLVIAKASGGGGSGSGAIQFADFTHTFDGTEPSNGPWTIAGPVPITGPFLLIGAYATVTADLTTAFGVPGNFQVYVTDSAAASVGVPIGDNSAQMGHGDFGATAGSWTNMTAGPGSFLNLELNGYDQFGRSAPTPSQTTRYYNVSNSTYGYPIIGGGIKIRIFYFQAPITSPF